MALQKEKVAFAFYGQYCWGDALGYWEQPITKTKKEDKNM